MPAALVAARLRYASFGLGVASAILSTVPAMGQPHALVPLPAPYFSIDAASPEAPLLGTASVLRKPGPAVAFQGAGLGLSNALDNLDALSGNRSDVPPSQQFLLMFGVDRQSVGSTPPDPALAATGRMFNVQDQAMRDQAPGDLYLGLSAFTRGPRGTPRGSGNNILVVNQGDTGGVDKDLSPTKAPIVGTPDPEQKSNSNSTAYTSNPARGASRDVPSELLPVYFSVSSDSPSLGALPGIPGTQSGADVFVDDDPFLGGTEALFVSATELGLIGGPLGDDIDAMIVFDNVNIGVFDPGTDEVMFSLAEGSPSLGPLGPADVFISQGSGVFGPFIQAGEVGLMQTDNIDCLELVATNDPATSIFNHAIFVVWPGDFIPDGHLDPFECGAFQICYSGDGLPYDFGAATVNVNVGPGAVFSPADVFVETGDTVRWTWVSGLHNVVSGESDGVSGFPDGAFFSGAPTSVAGTTFEVVFDEAFLNAYPAPEAVYPYFCQVHVGLGMVGSVTVMPHACATYDVDFDGDVDCEDWHDFNAVYLEASGTPCDPISVPDFVAALLGSPVVPAHACMADMNGDLTVDGLDIQPYVDMLLP